MSMSNAQVSSALDQLARLLQALGGNRFQAKAYRAAAERVRSYPRRVGDMVAAGESLTTIPGVGKGIDSAIREILETGTLRRVQELGGHLPAGTLEISEAAGLTIPETKRLMKVLSISSLQELRERAQGDDVEQRLGTRLAYRVRRGLAGVNRVLWADAEPLVEQLSAFLATVDGVNRVEPAGSWRRGKEVVGTLRFVVQTADPTGLERALREHGGVEEVHIAKAGRVECRLAGGLALVVRVAEAGEWGDALVEETGSAAHLAAARRASRKQVPPQPTEEAWYAARGLAFIPPELREDRAEVDAAAGDALPDLVGLDDIRGDLHAHTTASDGANNIAQMVKAARAKGYQYLAVTDHSKSLKITNGLDEQRLLEQIAEIDRVNAGLRGFRVLKGSEVDILQDGSLDFPPGILRRLDVVMCSVHSRFALSKQAQTERVVRAVQNPYLTCVGHLTGRLLLKRPGYELDLTAILDAVKKHGKMLEINSSPDRLDIDDTVALEAKRRGIPVLVNTDAHSIRELEFMRLGVQQARRGWLTPGDVVNTLPLPALLKRLQATRGKGASRVRVRRGERARPLRGQLP